MALSTDKRHAWSQIRYQYYISGRSDVIFQNFSAAGIMLGYAIETSYKQLLAELGATGSIMNSHYTRKLHEYLVCNYNFSLAPLVCMDFLDFVDDHLEARYPIQTEKVQNRLQPQGRLLSFNLNALSFYDDLMFQLDRLIYGQSPTEVGTSVYFRGAVDCKMFRGAFFFHGNYHAYLSQSWIIGMVTSHGGHQDEVDIIQNRNLELYDNLSFPVRADDVNQNAYVPNFCQNYRYVSSNQNSNGQPVWTLNAVAFFRAININ